MNAHVVCRAGTFIEVQLKSTKQDGDLDRTALDYLRELAQTGAEMRCSLKVMDTHVLIQLDGPVVR